MMLRYAVLMGFGVALLMIPIPSHESGAAESEHEPMGVFTPDRIQWEKGPPSLPAGAKMAVLEGDPGQKGLFVMRARVPDGYHIPPHTHPKTERITVISGTLYLAMGDRPDRSAAHRLPAGAFAFMPPGMKHAVWAEGETIVQLHGEGPWEINYLDPADDPRKGTR